MGSERLKRAREILRDGHIISAGCYDLVKRLSPDHGYSASLKCLEILDLVLSVASNLIENELYERKEV
ncbi:MAG: hypothetical protein DRO39_07260 [Thermoprotei archaeon]|nr:MAG: hypothetical protein DRO39_07260 [Thermoprotei archaeon]